MIWYNIVCIFCWINAITSPFIILWPELNENNNLINLLWLNELIWILDILRKFVVKPKKSIANDVYEIATAYIKSDFIFDVVATLP